MQNANGNMTMDLDHGITEIKYNLLNLPEEIRFSGGETIKNLYAADGRKLQSSNIYSTSVVSVPLTLTGFDPVTGETFTSIIYQSVTVYDGYGTKYAGNKEYLFEYEKSISAPGAVLVGTTPTNGDSITGLRIHNAEGYVDDAGNYNYYRRDHLGNNREVWQFPPSGGQGAVIQRTQYYPSGLPWAYQSGDGADVQPYKHNGKEFIETHGYDVTDHGNRGIHHASNRYTTMDRFSEKYPWQSPYVHANNNPVRNIDYLGLFAQDQVDKDKKEEPKEEQPKKIDPPPTPEPKIDKTEPKKDKEKAEESLAGMAVLALSEPTWIGEAALAIYASYLVWVYGPEIIENSIDFINNSTKKAKSTSSADSEYSESAEHKKKTPSKEEKHQKGQERKKKDHGGEKGDRRRKRYK